MAIPILVVDSDREFAKLVQEKLEASGQYAVHVSPTAAAALAAAPAEAFRLAVVDFALPDLSGQELIRRLRAAVRGISIIALLIKPDQYPVLPDELPPDGVLTKPVYMPDLLQAVNRALGLAVETPSLAAGASAGPWGLPAEFSDAAQLDPLLQRLSRECSAYAVLLTRKARLVAYAGSMPQPHVNEIVALLVKHGIREDLPGVVARFVRVPGAAEDFLLYALALNGQILLTLLYPARMPFSTVRMQAERLEAVLTGMAPEPARVTSPRPGAPASHPASTLPRDWIPNPQQARGELPHEVRPAPSVPVAQAPGSPEPETPPMTEPATAEPWVPASPGTEPAAEPSSPITRTLVICPRLPDHHLDGPLATRLQTWTARLCQAAEVRPVVIDVRPEYLLVTVELPPQVKPESFFHRLRSELSDSLLAAYPGLALGLRGGQFWADSSLINLPSSPSPETIQGFLHDLRVPPAAQD